MDVCVLSGRGLWDELRRTTDYGASLCVSKKPRELEGLLDCRDKENNNNNNNKCSIIVELRIYFVCYLSVKLKTTYFQKYIYVNYFFF
jgi:hypothetical protein